LELGQFAPLTSEQIGSQLSLLDRLWGDWRANRQDRIPSADDKRTALIGRGMVGQGLISEEELAEIHRVGKEMDRLRPELDEAHRQAQQAVTASQAERQAIKEQKKREAAERKRLRREAIERRKRTDILFLGRGVSRGLSDRRGDFQRLQQFGLPELANAADVAGAMRIDVPTLRWLAFHSEAATRTHYVSFSVAKRSGGQRWLSSPHQKLRQCQEWILQNILAKTEIHAAAHGFVKGRSTLTNAQPHVGQQVVLNADLCDFFPSITFPRVKGAFRSLGYSPAVATILALLCTESPRRPVTFRGTTYQVATVPRALPQGACTSPAISNLVSRRIDKRLAGIAAKLGWQYTRYADDLTFSTTGEQAANIGYLLARLRHIAQEEGFAINEKKTRVARPNAQQSVTGVVVNQRTGAPRKLVRRLRAILHRAKTEGLAAQNREDHPHFEGWLRGNIEYVNMLNPQQGAPLREAFEALQR